MSKVADRNQRQLLDLLKVPGNEVCADCKAKNCASLHRKMGTHISKVKSLTLDTWSRDQVEFMRANGNTRVNSLLNPDELRNPPPTAIDESERGSQLEKILIRPSFHLLIRYSSLPTISLLILPFLNLDAFLPLHPIFLFPRILTLSLPFLPPTTTIPSATPPSSTNGNPPPMQHANSNPFFGMQGTNYGGGGGAPAFQQQQTNPFGAHFGGGGGQQQQQQQGFWTG
ncbi:hypothetical protein RQP46_009889 [Phenoliferia psychrophenolica]